MPATPWLDLIAFGRYYIPSNDFSTMISEAMFEEFFLPGIVRECAFLYRRIQNAGEDLQILNMTTDAIELVMEQLRPEGVYIPSISGVGNADEVDAVPRLLAAWR